jgi:hypothetical protein
MHTLFEFKWFEYFLLSKVLLSADGYLVQCRPADTLPAGWTSPRVNLFYFSSIHPVFLLFFFPLLLYISCFVLVGGCWVLLVGEEMEGKGGKGGRRRV